MTRLLATLAFAGLGRRRLQAGITIVAVAGATAALTVALGAGRVADRPFDRTFEATNGAHVIVEGRSGTDLTPVEQLPGVVASTGQLPVAWGTFEDRRGTFGIRLVGTRTAPPEVSRPLVADGAWPREGEILVERSFARFLGLRAGDRLTVDGADLDVSGVGIVPVGQAYPQSQPGIAFATRATLDRLLPDSRRTALLGVRLADPDQADRFAAAAGAVPGVAAVESWTEERGEAVEAAHTITVILGIYSALILLASGAVLATLVGARVLGQVRDIGLLKATGVTPRQVAGVILLEQLTLAVVGCVLGLLVGRVVTPLVATRSAALLEASETPPLDLRSALIVIGAVLGLVAVFALVPALRAGMRTTAETLHAATTPAGRRSRLGALADRAGLPPSVTVGARSAFARPGRAVVTSLALALTVASVVGTLGMEASLDVASDPPPAPTVEGGLPAWDPVDDDAGEGATLRPIVYGLDIALLFVGLVSLVATVLLTVRERVRDIGMLKAVGLTPGQVTGTVVSSQSLLALLAAAVGIPLGLGLLWTAYLLTGSGDESAYPWWWSIVLLVPATVLVVVALTAPLARRAAQIPVAAALRYE